MEPTIYKPGAYNTPGIYKGAGGIYKGQGVYNDGAGGGGGDYVEIGGRKYPIINIGSLFWMSENLDLDIAGSRTNNNHPEYGRYYNYSQMDAIPCPTGWRLATYSDLQNLKNSASNSSNKLLVGGELGFEAMPCGEYFTNWGWIDVGTYFKMWSSTEYTYENRYDIMLRENDNISLGYSTESYRPVRLCKDA